jgi:hypothetical protein
VTLTNHNVGFYNDRAHFTEGLATPDLLAAKALLDTLD